MSDEFDTLSIASLSRYDRADLLDYLPADAVRFDEQRLAPGHLGEPVTATAIIAVTMTAITGVCAWISSKGKNITIKAALKVVGLDGMFEVAINQASTPETVRRDIEAKGGNVA